MTIFWADYVDMCVFRNIMHLKSIFEEIVNQLNR